MDIHPIAYAKNDFVDKFGIPRQSFQTSTIETRIVFQPPYNTPDAFREIQHFSHLWIIWGFSCNQIDHQKFSPTVRPPRLGGNKRVGVFASRSPFRPNALGLTSVRLLRVENTPRNGVELVVVGADLLDNTPIYDIKPYLSFTDAHPQATNGFAQEVIEYQLLVQWAEDELRDRIPENVRLQIEEILSQDPRPAYHDEPERVYKLDFANYKIHFQVQNQILRVVNVQDLNS